MAAHDSKIERLPRSGKGDRSNLPERPEGCFAQIGPVPFSATGPAPWGIYHVTNTGQTTWREMAVEIFRLAGMNVTVQPITTAEYGAPAARPSYSVLDTAAYHRLGGPPMPDWKAALTEYFAEWKEL